MPEHAKPEPNNAPPQLRAGEADPRDDDALYVRAVDLVIKSQSASVSMLQRSLRIGFSQACAYLDEMEVLGIVSRIDVNHGRTVLVKDDNQIPPVSDAPSGAHEREQKEDKAFARSDHPSVSSDGDPRGDDRGGSILSEDPDDEGCPTCGGTGELAHDCGEDTCCCLDKDGPMCPTCGGMG